MARHRARPLQRLCHRLRLPRSIGETITSLPYGDSQTTSGTCSDSSPMHFTGKMRDAESNLDDFDARYYSSQWGRFMIPDWDAKPAAVPYANFGNPQSLNLYAYVKNNPSTAFDPDGHCGDPGKPPCPNQAGTPPGTTPGDTADGPNQDKTSASAKRIAERVVLSAEGLVNLEVASVKIDAARAAAAATPESGPGAAATITTLIVSTWSASGNIVAGAGQLVGAFTGDTKTGEQVSQLASAAASPTGMGFLIGTGGNVQKAAKWASVEGIVTTNPKDVFKGRAVEKIAKIVDYALNLRGATGH